MPQYKITTDLFQLPYENNISILYAPLKGFLCKVNNDFIELLANIETLNGAQLTPEIQRLVDYLIQAEIINAPPEPARQEPRSGPEISPTKLALFPTNQCNLKCRYCYAGAGEFAPKVMDWEIATSAIEYFLGQMHRQNWTTFPLEFHGGGEPFYAWHLLQRIVSFAEEQCARYGFKLEVYAATNGILNERQLEWVTAHFTSLTVSFDGLPHVQDYHRPLPNNQGSFQRVDQTLHYFDEHNFPYGIRCTVSQYNQDLLEETVNFVRQNYRTKLLFLEPVNICGAHATNTAILQPDLYKFIENFKKLEPACAASGLRLAYSGAQFEKISPNFCYVGTDDFAVTPDGFLTNCWEVTSQEHPLVETFIFGKMLPDGKIQIDQAKLDFLRRLSVHQLDYCRDCFARWHCAGDCVTRLGHQHYQGPRGGIRCETNRELIKHCLIQMLERQDFYEPVQGEDCKNRVNIPPQSL